MGFLAFAAAEAEFEASRGFAPLGFGTGEPSISSHDTAEAALPLLHLGRRARPDAFHIVLVVRVAVGAVPFYDPWHLHE